ETTRPGKAAASSSRARRRWRSGSMLLPRLSSTVTAPAVGSEAGSCMRRASVGSGGIAGIIAGAGSFPRETRQAAHRVLQPLRPAGMDLRVQRRVRLQAHVLADAQLAG